MDEQLPVKNRNIRAGGFLSLLRGGFVPAVLMVFLALLLFARDAQVRPSTLLDGFAFSGHSLDISDETADARATFWNPDGTMMYVVGRATNNVVAYALSEPWDISSAQFVKEAALDGRSQHGLWISEDGKVMWVFDRTAIWTYALEEAWNVSAMEVLSVESVGEFVIRGHDIDFRPDGKSLFIDDRGAGAVFEVELQIPWDVSTGKPVATLDISDQQVAVRGIAFVEEGFVMLLLDTGRSEILQYDLSEPYDIGTAEYIGAFDLSGQTPNPRGLSLSSGQDAFYITCNSRGKIFQYYARPDAGKDAPADP